MKKLVSVVAPMYNEELLVEAYCAAVLDAFEPVRNSYDVEIILVNDGSVDATYMSMLHQQELHPQEITIVGLSRNFGLEGAVNAGLKKAQGDAVVVMDADLQDPPLLILEMLKYWEKGKDIVVGSRIKRSHDTLSKKFGASLYYKVLDNLSGKLKLEKSAANFRLLSRKALDMLFSLPEVNPVFRVVVPFLGMDTAVVEYDRDERYAGKTKYRLPAMIRYALDSLTGISIEPLRKIWLGFLLAVISFIVSIMSVFFLSNVWQPALLVIIWGSIMFMALFLILVVLGEYIGQIMIESKGRPTSMIYHYNPCDLVKERIK